MVIQKANRVLLQQINLNSFPDRENGLACREKHDLAQLMI